jgi:hypothetical protein
MFEDSRTEHRTTIGRCDRYIQPILAPSAVVKREFVLLDAGVEGGSSILKLSLTKNKPANQFMPRSITSEGYP